MTYNELHKVQYQLTNDGCEYPVQEKEFPVKPGQTVYAAVKSYFTKWRYAMDLKKGFEVRIVSNKLIFLTTEDIKEAKC